MHLQRSSIVQTESSLLSVKQGKKDEMHKSILVKLRYLSTYIG